MRWEIEKIWSFAQYLIFGTFLAEDLIFRIFGRNSDVESYSVRDTGINWDHWIANKFDSGEIMGDVKCDLVTVKTPVAPLKGFSCFFSPTVLRVLMPYTKALNKFPQKCIGTVYQTNKHSAINSFLSKDVHFVWLRFIFAADWLFYSFLSKVADQIYKGCIFSLAACLMSEKVCIHSTRLLLTSVFHIFDVHAKSTSVESLAFFS